MNGEGMTDEAAFWVEVRGGLIGMANAPDEQSLRRNILCIVAAIERRYKLGAHAEPERVAPRWLDAEANGTNAAA